MELNEDLFTWFEEKVASREQANSYVSNTRKESRKVLFEKYGLEENGKMTDEMYEEEQNEFMSKIFDDNELFDAIWLVWNDRQQRDDRNWMDIRLWWSEYQALLWQIPALAKIEGNRIEANFAMMNEEKVIVFSGVNWTLTVPFDMSSSTFVEVPWFDSEQRESFKEEERNTERSKETLWEKRAKYEIEQTLESWDGVFDLSDMWLSSVDVEKVIWLIVNASKDPDHEYYTNNNDITINLEGNDLRWLPSELFCVNWLHKMDLDNNYIQWFDDFPLIDDDWNSISYDWLQSLTNLSIANCNFTSLPDTLLDMTHLQKINVSNNRLSWSALDKIESCRNIVGLSAFNNDLTTCPDPSNWSNLQHIGLWWNNISTLPDDRSNCSSLEKAYLWDNKIKEIPESLCKLTEVTNLNLSKNALETIPPMIWNMASMEYLDLSDNNLNRIWAIPASLWSLTKLKRLDLDGNKLNWEMLPKTLWSISSTIRLYKNTSKWSDLLWEYFDGWYTRQGYKLDENYKIQEFVQNDQKYKVGIEEWSSLEDATQKAMDQLNLNEESPKYVLSRENYSWSYEVILITNHESV